jgi:hypothetical protein
MQSAQEVDDIHEFFGGLERGSRFVVIPKRTLLDDCGWLDTPYRYIPFDGHSALHLRTFYKVIINHSIREEDYDEDDYEDGDEIFSYFVHCVLTDYPRMCSQSDLCCAIGAVIDNDTGTWHYKLWYDYRADMSNFYRGCNPRCDAISFAMKGGAQSLPAICAAACTERSNRVEKATFFALLARRFGDALADELTRATYPGLKPESANHSLLDAA